MHLLVIIIWLAWNTCNIEFSGFMAVFWAVFFVARGGLTDKAGNAHINIWLPVVG